MTWLLLAIVVLALFFLDHKASKGLALLKESVELLRQLRDASNRSEQDALERRAAEIKRAVGTGSQPPPIR